MEKEEAYCNFNRCLQHGSGSCPDFCGWNCIWQEGTARRTQADNSYQMSGNKVSVRTLDLNRDFSEIAAQLNAIVIEHFA